MTTLTDVKARLVELELTLAGLNWALADAPDKIAELPGCLNFTGPALYSEPAKGLIVEARTFITRWYIMPRAAGVEFEPEETVNPWLPQIRDLFAAYPTLRRMAGVKRARLVSDGGVMVLPFGGIEYLGAEYRVEVSFETGVKYGHGE